METENKEINEEEKTEINQQNQTNDHPDNFSDQEIEDDFYKIQIENYKNKTSSNFHRNIRLINEKGREIRSARFLDIRHKQFNEPKEKTKPKKENSPKQQAEQEQNKLVLNNSSGQAENSTTVMNNNSGGLQKSYQLGTASGEEGSGSGGDEKAKKDEDSMDSDEESEESENEENKKINLPPPREPNEEILNYY